MGVRRTALFFIFVLILFTTLFVGNKKISTQRTVTGKVIIPSIDLAKSDDSILVRIEIEHGETLSFRLELQKIDKLLDTTIDFETGQSPAIMTVQFNEDLFGKISNVKVVNFTPGWIKRSK